MSLVGPQSRAGEACGTQQLGEAVLRALAESPKRIDPKWIYDHLGSELFVAITRLPEYYLTRIELGILADASDEISQFLGPETTLIEYGAGSVGKADHVLASLERPQGYTCVEIEASAAAATVARLRDRFPSLAIQSQVGDFTEALTPLPPLARGAYAGFFLGSTLGNFDPDAARQLLRQFRHHLGAEARCLLGLDRVKPIRPLLHAYADPAGVTAAFNLNLLTRINRELAGDFQPAYFRHSARMNIRLQRMEMHIVSTRAQRVTVRGHRFHFQAGESLHTESSYKYSAAAIHALLHDSGWRLEREWSDAEQWFSLLGLVAH